ncbi:pilus assembly protein PilM [Thermogutta sp.]|uniref:pilus assembly protein PilM n=1 Tax=Thermogutta sp. TaxID=1962930 RepID=UPI0032201376
MLRRLWDRPSPIGLDIGTCTIKAIQLDSGRNEVLELAEVDVPRLPNDPQVAESIIAQCIQDLLKRRRFWGRRVALALGFDEITVQSIRVSPLPGKNIGDVVLEEARSRTNLELNDVEIRFLPAGIVQQGELQRQEMVLIVAKRTAIERKLRIAQQARVIPVAIDAEPLALVRAAGRQYRRQSDQNQTMMFVHIGSRATLVVTVRNERLLFAKYFSLGGREFDLTLARQFHIPEDSARALRRSYGDRRVAQRDPEVVATVQDTLRPVWNRWLEELSRCFRYCNVTFRGEPAEKIVLSGGEAAPELQDVVSRFFEIPVDLLDCFRGIKCTSRIVDSAVWDIALGLALHSGRAQRESRDTVSVEEPSGAPT